MTTKISLTMDPGAMSIEGVREYYNWIVADYGVGEVRNGKFPDKATAVKRLEGLLVEVKASQGVDETYTAPDGANSPATAKGKAVNKAVSEALAKKTKSGRASKITPDTKIFVVKHGKSREGTPTAAVRAAYQDGITFAELEKKMTGVDLKKAALRDYVAFDVRKGFIKVSG